MIEIVSSLEQKQMPPPNSVMSGSHVTSFLPDVKTAFKCVGVGVKTRETTKMWLTAVHLKTLDHLSQN